jgi:hypothetical protein
MPWASSSTAATGQWFNLYDRRSRVEGQPPEKLTLYKGEEALHVGKRTGGRRADLLLAGLALFCLGILLSFLATAATGVPLPLHGRLLGMWMEKH